MKKNLEETSSERTGAYVPVGSTTPGPHTSMHPQHERVGKMIGYMRSRVRESLTLSDLADLVGLSRFHASVQFRAVTGVSPYLFFAALRMDLAKRTLLQPNSTVTETCYFTGYASLGTFSRLFRRLVGMSPREFQRRARDYDGRSFLAAAMAYVRRQTPESTLFVSRIASAESSHLIFAGTFVKAIPLGRPLSGTLLFEPGTFSLARPNCARYWLLAMSMPIDVHPFAPDQRTIRVGKMQMRSSSTDGSVPSLHLAPVTQFDPPIVIALPSLLQTD